MDRTACVDLPALPLQILLRSHPDWRGCPVAVVDKDKPQGVILWVNEAARRGRILPGMRYAAALSLDAELRAGVVSDEEIADAVDAITGELWRFTPEVEPSPDDPGVFWLDASGIVPLYASLRAWASRVLRGLKAERYHASIAVGFTRFGSFAAARAGRSLVVFDSREEEAAHCRAVPIDRLGFAPKLRDRLLELGVERLGDFLALPAAGIRRRFGKEAHALHALAGRDTATELTPLPLSEPLERSLILDRPEAVRARVMAAIESLLAPLVTLLAGRQHAVRRVRVRLLLDDNSSVEEELDPAEPTLDVAQVLHLVDLRLAGAELSSGVDELHVAVTGVPRVAHQRDLFTAPPRDLAAARRALARIRAELGDHAVVQAYSLEGHLPEARFGLGAFGRLEEPAPVTTESRPLVRRFFPRALPLPMRSKFEPDGWILDFTDGPVEEVVGPFVVQGGWWLREVRREYYYARTRNGRWLWLYHDKRRRRWFLQGEVE